MSFDRLVDGVDAWASTHARTDVFAQVGPTDRPPSHVPWVRFLRPTEFKARMREAGLVIGHAGMGTILAAMEHGKPLVIMPRRGSLRETRNDHQVATAKQFRDRPGLTVVMDEEELRHHLDTSFAPTGTTPISPVAPPAMIDAISQLVKVGIRPRPGALGVTGRPATEASRPSSGGVSSSR